MQGTVERFGRLVVTAGLIPVAGWLAYLVARYLDGNPETIDSNGSSVGLLMMVVSLFLLSKLASTEGWSERAGIALGLSTAYFVLSWVLFGDPDASADAAPHVVWFAACVFAFSPAVVLMPASKWAWSAYRTRRGLL